MSMAADGFQCVALSEDSFHGLEALRYEVQQAIQASQTIKAIKTADIPDEIKEE